MLLYLFLLVLFAYSILSWLTYSGRMALDSPVSRSSACWPGSASRSCARCAGSSRPCGSAASGIDLSVLVVFLVIEVLINTVFY